MLDPFATRSRYGTPVCGPDDRQKITQYHVLKYWRLRIPVCGKRGKLHPKFNKTEEIRMTINSAVMDLIDAEAGVKEALQLAKIARAALYDSVITRSPDKDPVGTYQYLGKQIIIPEDWYEEANFDHLAITPADLPVIQLEKPKAA